METSSIQCKLSCISPDTVYEGQFILVVGPCPDLDVGVENKPVEYDKCYSLITQFP